MLGTKLGFIPTNLGLFHVRKISELILYGMVKFYFATANERGKQILWSLYFKFYADLE